MAFIERVMQWGNHPQDTEPPTFEPRSRHITVHDFYAACIELAFGNLTLITFKNVISATPEDEVDIDAIVAKFPGPDASKALFVHRIHAIFLLAETRWTTYNTPAAIRTHLGI